MHFSQAAVSWTRNCQRRSPRHSLRLRRPQRRWPWRPSGRSALVALALVLCLRLAPRVSAAHRFAVWAAGFRSRGRAAVSAYLRRTFAAAAIAQSPPLAAAQIARPGFNSTAAGDSPLPRLWLAASASRAADLGLPLAAPAQTVEVCDTRRRRPKPPRASRRSSSRRRPIEICTTRDLDRPSVIGFFAPRILIPDWLFSRLTPGEFEQVVLHEAEHLRRRDDWTNLLQKLSLVLFPLNPALAWMERRLCREREMACDEGVVEARRRRAPMRPASPALPSVVARIAAPRLSRSERSSAGRSWFVACTAFCARKQALHPLAARALVGVVGCGLSWRRWNLRAARRWSRSSRQQARGAQSASARTDASPSGLQRAANSLPHATDRQPQSFKPPASPHDRHQSHSAPAQCTSHCPLQ